MRKTSCDLAILGGGLAGCLIALAVQRKHPDLSIRIFEEGTSLGGNHIWSFFASDIAKSDTWLVAPLICHGWSGYDVRFPKHSRSLDALYYSIESERLDQIVRQQLPKAAIVTGVRALAASDHNVVLDNGVRVEARAVIDSRGSGNAEHLNNGWQKFMGQVLHLSEPHGLERPVIMDATVEQIDGYRFVYCLPMGPTSVFVEDTYYSHSPDLDTQAISARISRYAEDAGWDVERVTRTETGVLPVVTGGDFDGYWRSSGERVAKAGARAALFHALTSYSLPDAVRYASFIANQPDLSGKALAKASMNYASEHWAQAGFYRMLGKMLFASDTTYSYRIFERFYTLPQALIERFYAGQSTLYDKARILTGKPPMPIGRAVVAILTK